MLNWKTVAAAGLAAGAIVAATHHVDAQEAPHAAAAHEVTVEQIGALTAALFAEIDVDAVEAHVDAILRDRGDEIGGDLAGAGVEGGDVGEHLLSLALRDQAFERDAGVAVEAGAVAFSFDSYRCSSLMSRRTMMMPWTISMVVPDRGGGSVSGGCR